MRLLLLILCLCALTTPVTAQTTCGIGPCSIVGEPDISNCEAGLDKHLARAMLIRGLVSSKATVPWADSCNDAAYACSMPYTACPNGSCPKRYCEDIATAVALKATFLIDVAGSWGDEWRLSPGSHWYEAAEQCVKDINTAYDCAGLPRPIIGASIFEWVSEVITGRAIPPHIVALFSDEPDFTTADFPAGVTYDLKSIEMETSQGTPDISKLQTRMWLYQCAETYIKLGYRNIQLDMMGWSLGQGKDPSREKSYRLLGKIRAYAASKGVPILLSASVKDELFFYEGKMMFDFRLGALRPMEAEHSITAACTGQMDAFLSDKVGETYPSTMGGTAPGGCYYARVPFVGVMDHHAGICGTAGSPDNLDYCIYGYDESRWFNALSEDCQYGWLEYAVKEVKKMADRGYVGIPGKLVLNPWPPSRYRLFDKPVVLAAIRNKLWAVDSTTDWTSTLQTTKKIKDCEDGVSYATRYTFSASMTDASSVFTWRIQRPDGISEDFTIGPTVNYAPAMAGYYNITMKQHNLGFYPDRTGIREVTKSVYLAESFCRTSFRMSPNPSNGHVVIRTNYPISDVYVFSAFGRIVLEERAVGSTMIPLDVIKLAQGTYWVRVTYDDGNSEIKELAIAH